MATSLPDSPHNHRHTRLVTGQPSLFLSLSPSPSSCPHQLPASSIDTGGHEMPHPLLGQTGGERGAWALRTGRCLSDRNEPRTMPDRWRWRRGRTRQDRHAASVAEERATCAALRAPAQAASCHDKPARQAFRRRECLPCRLEMRQKAKLVRSRVQDVADGPALGNRDDGARCPKWLRMIRAQGTGVIPVSH